jgi:hypothetical protein
MSHLLPPSFPALFVAFAALAAATPAQAVHRVGPGHLRSIQEAVDAAAPHDLVVVDAGVYPAFSVGKPLTISAAPSALVRVVGAGAVAIALQPNERAHLGGLDVQVGAVTIHGGMVSMERCTVRTDRGLRLANTLLAMRWCAAGAKDASGVAVVDSHLHASDSTFSTAAAGAGTIQYGAVRLDAGGTIELSTCTLVGAWPLDPQRPFPSVPLHVSRAFPAARTWLSGCTLIGGFHPSGPQGPAIVARPGASPAAATTRVHRCIVHGLVIGAVAEGPVTTIQTQVDMLIGAPFTTTMRGEPGHVLMFYGGGDPSGVFTIVEAEQLALAFANLVVIGTSFADAQGAASFSFVVPNVPALRGSVSWWRGFDLSLTPWQVTPTFATIVQ